MSADWTAVWAWVSGQAWLLGGALAVVAAFTWRQVHRRRTRAQVARALQDPDPSRRLAGVGLATEQGLRAYSRLLAARIDEETDPAVRSALVEGVLRNAWEPADRPSIVKLRLWAHEERASRTIPRGLPVADPPTTTITRVAVPLPRRVPSPGAPRHRAPATSPLPRLVRGHG